MNQIKNSFDKNKAREIFLRDYPQYIFERKHTAKRLKAPTINKTEYNTIHVWLKRNIEKQKLCEGCRKKKELQFALKLGLYHSKNPTHYFHLCHKCHVAYDWGKLTLSE